MEKSFDFCEIILIGYCNLDRRFGIYRWRLIPEKGEPPLNDW